MADYPTSQPTLTEQTVQAPSGWTMFFLNCVLAIVAVGLFLSGMGGQGVGRLFLAVPLGVAFLFIANGFFSLQPNEAAVLVFFGKYVGTVRDSGFFWTNPFNQKFRISLRSRNLNGEKIKVNDKRGTPIEIAAVIVWKIRDTAQAMFDVDDYENYVKVQSESAVRHVASSYIYDDGEAGEVTLRGGADTVAEAMKVELQERFSRAGVEVQEARIAHLAYAPEIAQAMLRRQQAEAVIAARSKIVQGAVSMVEMALKELSEKKIIEFDQNRKAAMVSNLLVVLCSETETQPIINTGTAGE